MSRVNRSKRAAKQAYDRLSHIYDFLAGSSETQFLQFGLEMLAITSGDTVLEIGCGTGRALANMYRQAGDHGLICGLDLSPGMLKVAKYRLAKCRPGKSVQLSCGDGVSLPYSGGIFSALFMGFTLELFDTPEIPLVLAECWRVLKPDGRLGVIALTKPERPSRLVRLYEWFHAHFPNFIDCRPIYTESMIEAKGFMVEKRSIKSMWGLPVTLLLARKG